MVARIRRSITTNVCRTIVHSMVMSRLDYCNAVLYGLPDAQLQKLQLVQNAAARLPRRNEIHDLMNIHEQFMNIHELFMNGNHIWFMN